MQEIQRWARTSKLRPDMLHRPADMSTSLRIPSTYQAAGATLKEYKSTSSRQSPSHLSKLPRGIPNIARYKLGAEVLHLIPLAVHPKYCTKDCPLPWLVLWGPHELNVLSDSRIPDVSFSVSERPLRRLNMQFSSSELAEQLATTITAS